VKLSRGTFVILNGAAMMLALLLIWPVIQVLIGSFTSDIVFPPHHFNLNSFRSIIWPSYFLAIRFSLLLGVSATVLLILICLPAAYAIERRRFRGRSLLSVLIFVPVIFPGVTYVSAISIYVLIFYPHWRGTFPVILLGTAMAAIPLVVRALQSSLATADPVYEEAALVMGASPLKAFARVTLPLIGPGLVTASMIAFTAAAMSFTPAYILGSGQPTAALYIYREIDKVGFTPSVAVMILSIQAVVIGIVQNLYWVFRRQFRGLFD
jgi:ABC-type spermidine/putrescine transport system permease subunit II